MTQDENGETIVPAGEAALITRDGMNDLALLLPYDVDREADVPPAVRFLTAVMLRADDEPGWVESMIQWLDDKMARDEMDEIGDTAGEA